jgi:hypothetical protein
MSAIYLQTLRALLPTQYQAQVDELCKSQHTEISGLVESLIRFTSGGDPPTTASAETRGQWKSKQSTARIALDALNPHNDNKRVREDDITQPQNGVKRQKLPEQGSITMDDPPLFRLHSISATSPVRKKVDITIHKLSIKFTHPSSHAIEATVPLSSLHRAFILPTRGKQKPHWTVVLLSSDTPEHGKPSALATQSNPQIIFGLDAIASTSMTTTSYTSPEPTKTNLAKSSETLASIRKLLSYAGSPVLQPTPEVFRSACAGNPNTSASTGGVPGVEAYRAAKPGSLWFMKEGILWGESKPCEFWAVEDLFGKDGGLRMLSATGRTCSVILTRKPAATGEEDEDEDDENLGIETEFAMVDGREQEGINKWVRQHRHLFGKQAVQHVQGTSATIASGSGTKAVVAGEAVTLNAAQLDDESDASDESFDVDSDDDDNSSTTSSDNSDAESRNEDDAGSGMESEEGEETDDGGDEDEDDLRPVNHPLMRPGAMPRMSRAAIDAVVGMVNDDLMGGGASEGEDELLDD